MSGIERWIDPRHLHPDSMERMASSFAGDPLNTIWLDDFLMPEPFANLQRVFATEGAFEQVHRLYERAADGRARDVTPEEWRDAEPGRRFHDEMRFAGPKPEHRLSPGMVTHVRFRMFLQSAAHLAFLHRLTGLCAGVAPFSLLRITRYGQRLDRHNDFNHGRTLCSVLYFGTGWQPTFGGRLRQYEGDALVRALDPLPNRLVLFRPTLEQHDVEPLGPAAAHWERWAMTTWYAPPGRVPGGG
ncbi:2OG-Fe(II) oxygenase [Azospirillum sp. TSO22-1]|uniref:2OG-Fe(II) oxygenase n=1 Tax=Azospirillum sp. TSO22-1 TaxID=716789 RepID=UPI000D610166|nr:2OG-Fe(II) oxygenase [Azospirillum sp. TSO22-1]PWC56396.1 hypothetical protein TSO221_02160 [Azospirillum sp. TSO22-1]